MYMLSCVCKLLLLQMHMAGSAASPLCLLPCLQAHYMWTCAEQAVSQIQTCVVLMWLQDFMSSMAICPSPTTTASSLDQAWQSWKHMSCYTLQQLTTESQLSS